MKDVRQRYAHVKDDIHVTLIEVLCFKELLFEFLFMCLLSIYNCFYDE